MKNFAAWLERSQKRDSYVYELAYPDGRVFYVGKGTGNRISRHEDEARRGVHSAKCDTIRQIWATGGKILKRKVHENLTSDEALVLEQELIQRHGTHNLTNFSPMNEAKPPETITPVNICLFKEFREEIENSIKLRMVRDGIEPTPQACYQYIQSICMQAIRDYLNDAAPE